MGLLFWGNIGLVGGGRGRGQAWLAAFDYFLGE
jgi:hypothetical protein